MGRIVNTLKLAVFAASLFVAAAQAQETGKSPVTEVDSWKEEREIDGKKQWVEVRTWHDAETDNDFTIYFAEGGSPLPATVQAEFARSQPISGVAASVPMEHSNPNLPSGAEQQRKQVARPPSLAGKTARQNRDAVSRRVELGTLTAEEGARITSAKARQASRPGQKLELVGITRYLTADIVFLGAGRNVTWTPAGDGGWVARTAITSTGAAALRIHWQGANLPEGVVLSVLKADGSPDGDSLGKDDLADPEGYWAGSIMEESAIIEVYLPSGANPTDQGPELAVSEVAHRLAPPTMPKSSTSSIGEGTCNNDITCQSTAWKNVGKSVAHILFEVSGDWYVCTGSLLNDADSTTQKPYFMTANHCVDSQTVASTIEFYWFFATTSCSSTPSGGPVAYDDSPQVVRTTGGGVLLRTIAGEAEPTVGGSDFTFLQLNTQPPSGVTFAGWNTSSFANNTTVYSIHHPQGAYKRFSEAFKITHDTQFWTVQWKSGKGITEGGSSGGPLYNSSQEFIGQLWGGSSSCASPGAYDYYGRFIPTYDYISGYLNGTYFTTQPQSATIAAGTTRTLTASAGNGGSYRWYTGTPGSGTVIPGATSSSYTTPILNATTSYYVEIRKTGVTPVLTVNSAAALITVVQPPVITLQPTANTERAAGQTASFTTTSTGGAPLSYQWFEGTTPGTGGTSITGATTVNFTTPALNATTSYWLRVSNSVATVYSSLATVTILPAPSITGQPPASTEKLAGQTAQFSVTASGSSLSYQWYEGATPGSGGTLINGATSASYTTPALNASTSYWVRVSNVGGTVYSNLASVTVFANAYYQWASSKGIPGVAPTVDTDVDGLDNELEFILNFDPKANSRALLPVSQFAPGTGIPMITFAIASGLPAGTTVTVESSINLSTWAPADVTISGTTVTATAGAATDPERYFKVHGTLAP